MNRNKLLRIVLLLCNVSLVGLLLSVVLLTTALIWWHIDPEFYSNMKIPILGEKCFFKVTSVTSYSVGNSTIIETAPMLNNIAIGSLYFLYLQLAAIHVLSAMALYRFAGIIRSVHKVRTFATENARAFRSIGIYMLGVFVISGFQYTSYGQTSLLGVYVHLQPLLVSALAFTMSEVFKEGHALLEDNLGTI